jgi:pyruvate formate lyase activating enzyme
MTARKSEHQGIIFDVKRYAVHDGPGIRTTVFFKGCPLECAWCHNPEGISQDYELIFKEKRCIELCRECEAACPQNAISRDRSGISIDRNSCQVCGTCAAACPSDALEKIGKAVSAKELMNQILKDEVFFSESGGGVTFSGGEPLLQSEFLAGVLEECRIKKIHTCLDTCGYAPLEALERIASLTDLFLFDLKMMDDKKHIVSTGASNRIILDNLRYLDACDVPLIIRMPLIPGLNDSRDDIELAGGFIRSLHHVKQIDLLPYHDIAAQKYCRLQRKDKMAGKKPSGPDRLLSIREQLKDFDLNVFGGDVR